MTMTPLQGMARLTALLFYHFAAEAEDSLGVEDGHALVSRAIRRMGRERGKLIRARVDAAGLAPTLENMFRYYDLPIGEAWETSSQRVGERFTQRLHRCPLAAVWQERGAEAQGMLYCDVDIAIIEGYNPDIAIRRMKNLQNGDDCCEYEYVTTGA